MTNAEARFNKSLRPRKPEGSLRRTAQDGHLDSHTAPELWGQNQAHKRFKASKERLFIMTQTQNLQIFGVTPFVKLQNDI